MLDSFKLKSKLEKEKAKIAQLERQIKICEFCEFVNDKILSRIKKLKVGQSFSDNVLCCVKAHGEVIGKCNYPEVYFRFYYNHIYHDNFVEILKNDEQSNNIVLSRVKVNDFFKAEKDYTQLDIIYSGQANKDSGEYKFYLYSMNVIYII